MWFLVRKEIILSLRNWRLVLGTAITGTVLVVSILLAGQEHRERVAEYNREEASRREWVKAIQAMGAEMQYREVIEGSRQLYDVRPVASLGILADGLERYLPVLVQAGEPSMARARSELTRNPLWAVAPALDFSFAVTFIMSLLAILYSYDAVSGEREQGTLLLMLANPVARARVLVAKMVSGCICVSVPLVVGLAIGLLAPTIAGEVRYNGTSVLRLLMLVAGSALYSWVFYGMGLLVSVCTRRACISFINCLIVWGLWVLMVPSLAPGVARFVRPVPSEQWLNEQKGSIQQETRAAVARLRPGPSTRADLDRLRLRALSQEEEVDRQYVALWRTRCEIARAMARISPAATYRLLSTELAETGYTAFWNNIAGESRFRRDVQDFVEMRQRAKIYDGVSGRFSIREGWFEAEELPRLQSAGPGNDLRQCVLDMGTLAALAIALFMGSYLLFNRGELR